MVVGTDMYVTGTLDSAGTVRAVNIAKWDGNAWSSMGTGQQGNFLTRGSGIAVGNGEVYVAGKWPDSTLVYIAKWNGSTWTAVGRDVGNPVHATVNSIAFSGTDIYVGGAGFPYATGSEIGVERFNTLTARWHSLGNTPSMEVYALAVRGADVFLGGWFRGSGTVSAYKIAKWNGTTWSALGAGVGGTNGGGYVRAIAVSGNRVYVGGAFNSAGTVSANNIAVWDDSTVHDPVKAVNILRGNGCAVKEADVLAVECPDHPGGVNAVLKPLKNANINVLYLYPYLGRVSDQAIVILGVDKTAEAKEVLQRNSVKTLGKEIYNI